MVTLASGNGIIGIFVYAHFSFWIWILLVARGGFLIQKPNSKGIDI
jgi:hypothetical protein